MVDVFLDFPTCIEFLPLHAGKQAYSKDIHVGLDGEKRGSARLEFPRRWVLVLAVRDGGLLGPGTGIGSGRRAIKGRIRELHMLLS